MYAGRAGDWLLILTGDDFKVIRVSVVVRNAARQRVEEGFAKPASGSAAVAWIYGAQTALERGQTLTLEVTATDRCDHSSSLTVLKEI